MAYHNEQSPEAGEDVVFIAWGWCWVGGCGGRIEARSLEAANARADLTEPLVNHLNTLARLFNKPSIVVFCSRSSNTG
jgi:hypothetical protein